MHVAGVTVITPDARCIAGLLICWGASLAAWAGAIWAPAALGVWIGYAVLGAVSIVLLQRSRSRDRGSHRAPAVLRFGAPPVLVLLGIVAAWLATVHGLVAAPAIASGAGLVLAIVAADRHLPPLPGRSAPAAA